MTYQHFATVYDRLMEDAPYDKWISFLTKVFKQYKNNSVQSILDIACGTGEISIRLAREGYNVQGVDLSETMLTVAREKAERNALRIPFYLQDMSELEGFTQQDAVLIFCDSLNYLTSIEGLQATIRGVNRSLNSNGLFLFDVHSLYKINELFHHQSFTYNANDISYIWECMRGAEEDSIEHDLSIFVHVEDSLYQRYNEWHYQKTYSIDTYTSLLKREGFELLSITSDFTDTFPTATSERLFFVCRKIK